MTMNRIALQRALVLGLGAVAGILLRASQPGPLFGRGWFAVLMPLAVGALGIPFVLGVSGVTGGFATPWQRPTWNISLSARTGPLQFFTSGGCYFLAAGLAGLVLLPWRGLAVAFSALSLFCFGAGTLAGVRISMILYRGKLAAA